MLFSRIARIAGVLDVSMTSKREKMFYAILIAR
jgi:hypothetical protein